jgi:hypothetical protein
MLKFAIAVVLLLSGTTFLGAQSLAHSTNGSEARPAQVNQEDKVIFADQSNKTFFIDFERINVNLSGIVVKDILGGVVFKDEVANLPVDTIYELNLSRMSPGTYDIELQSYTGVIKKTVTLP